MIFREITQTLQLFTKHIKTEFFLQNLLKMPSSKAWVERSTMEENQLC
jgi:hypothetical protein